MKGEKPVAEILYVQVICVAGGEWIHVFKLWTFAFWRKKTPFIQMDKIIYMKSHTVCSPIKATTKLDSRAFSGRNIRIPTLRWHTVLQYIQKCEVYCACYHYINIFSFFGGKRQLNMHQKNRKYFSVAISRSSTTRSFWCGVFLFKIGIHFRVLKRTDAASEMGPLKTRIRYLKNSLQSKFFGPRKQNRDSEGFFCTFCNRFISEMGVEKNLKALL